MPEAQHSVVEFWVDREGFEKKFQRILHKNFSYKRSLWFKRSG